MPGCKQLQLLLLLLLHKNNNSNSNSNIRRKVRMTIAVMMTMTTKKKMENSNRKIHNNNNNKCTIRCINSGAKKQGVSAIRNSLFVCVRSSIKRSNAAYFASVNRALKSLR